MGLRKTRRRGHGKKRQTRQNKNNQKEHVEHHHLLLRMESRRCPAPEDKEEAKHLIETIIHDIHMKLLGEPRVYYVTMPKYNEGLTAIAPIQTSHIAFHFWANPERAILKNKASHCLLEFDIYTCGKLTLKNIERILHHLTRFEPTHANVTLLNRKYSLTLERQLLWDESDRAWKEWVDSIPSM